MNVFEENEDQVAKLIQTLLKYCDHEYSCAVRNEERAKCDCGLEDAINEAIKLGHIETTQIARWQPNGAGTGIQSLKDATECFDEI